MYTQWLQEIKNSNNSCDTYWMIAGKQVRKKERRGDEEKSRERKKGVWRCDRVRAKEEEGVPLCTAVLLLLIALPPSLSLPDRMTAACIPTTTTTLSTMTTAKLPPSFALTPPTCHLVTALPHANQEQQTGAVVSVLVPVAALQQVRACVTVVLQKCKGEKRMRKQEKVREGRTGAGKIYREMARESRKKASCMLFHLAFLCVCRTAPLEDSLAGTGVSLMAGTQLLAVLTLVAAVALA